MGFWQAALYWFGGLFVFSVMFTVAENTGGFAGFIVFAFTLVVLGYVTGFFNDFKK